MKKENAKNYIEIKRIIQQAKNEEQLVLFVGSGTSLDAGMPSWSDAVNQIWKSVGSKTEKPDNLLVPQYYYNQRGKKEYTQLMRTIFKYNEKLSIQPIHEKIIEFNTNTIITTNYDNLIEQAAEKKGVFLQVISQDKDLPYRKAGKELVKIHGDFEHDNYVLKEDDYLHYHNNFKLIENYIKSIIGTKTVLFLGYSLSDPDVKQVFAWVKEILSNEFQNAYLIEAKKYYDENESEYYKHLGVNLIYASELLADDFSKSDPSANLLKVVEFLLQDQESNDDYLELLWRSISPYRPINYIYNLYLRIIFNNSTFPMISYQNESLLFDINRCKDNPVAISFVEEVKGFLSDDKKIKKGEKYLKYKDVFQLLSKSNIKQMCFWGDTFDKNINYDIKTSIPESKLFDYVKRFDIKSIKQLKDINEQLLSEQDPELYMQQSYICCFLHDYIPAYFCVSNAAQSFYRKKEYVWYFIAICNKAKIGKLIANNIFYHTNKNIDFVHRIESEIEKIDLNDIFKSLPGIDSGKYSYLKDLIDFNVSSATFYDVFADYIKSNEEANTTYFWFGGVPAYERISTGVWDYYQYCLYNYIFTQQFREDSNIYNLFSRAILYSVCTPDRKNRGSSYEHSSNVHAEQLSFEDIHLIIRFMSASKLSRLLNEIGADIIPLSEDGNDYMQELADNLKETLNDYSLYDGIDGLYWNYLCLASHISLNKKLVLTIVETLSSINKVDIYQRQKNIIQRFFVSVYKQKLFADSQICKEVKKIITLFIGFVRQDQSYINLFQNLINVLVAICQENGELYSNSKNVKMLLAKEYYLMLVDIYPICNDTLQGIIREELKKWHCSNSIKDLTLYSQMLIHDLITPNDNAEKLAFIAIEKENKIVNSEGLVINSGHSNLIGHYLDLYLNDKLIDKDKFIRLVNESNYNVGKWLIDIENYNYDDFDINWLNGCSDFLLKSISSNEIVKRKIVEKYKGQYFYQFIEKRVTEKIVEYFL